MTDKNPNQNDSDLFEEELDEFFKERAMVRTASFWDKSNIKTSSAREQDPEVAKQLKEDKDTKSDRVLDDEMSGCCMTGCPDCPWGFGTHSDE